MDPKYSVLVEDEAQVDECGNKIEDKNSRGGVPVAAIVVPIVTVAVLAIVFALLYPKYILYFILWYFNNMICLFVMVL